LSETVSYKPRRELSFWSVIFYRFENSSQMAFQSPLSVPQKTEESEGEIFKTAAFYALNILVTPILTFLLSKFVILEGVFGLQSTTGNIWSAIIAVVVLHVMLALYLYRTFYPAKKSSKQD